MARPDPAVESLQWDVRMDPRKGTQWPHQKLVRDKDRPGQNEFGSNENSNVPHPVPGMGAVRHFTHQKLVVFANFVTFATFVTLSTFAALNTLRTPFDHVSKLNRGMEVTETRSNKVNTLQP